MQLVNSFSRPLLVGAALFLAGCKPKEPAPPAAPVRDEAAARRDWLFGARAEAKDIVWRASGLGIKLLAAGEGVAPTPMDRVRVHYTLTLKDGRVVDDTRSKGQPAEFAVNRLMIGWAAGMGELKPGGRAEFFIPPSLGYGNMSVAGIPAGSGLIFDVELLAVNPEVPPKS